MKLLDLKLEGDCPEDYPMQPKRHSNEFEADDNHDQRQRLQSGRRKLIFDRHNLACLRQTAPSGIRMRDHLVRWI